jgi:mitosis inhibitor protein kinase SWE1
LNGLKYIHEKNIIHLDVKCANIFVDSDGIIKLGDFGCSKKTFQKIKDLKGSIPWMAPEVLL